MASVTYNNQAFSIDGRRVWVLGATLHYARIPAASWAERIAAAREAGFNTIEVVCPWLVHEPRRGRYVFQDQTDVGRFVTLCHEAGMYVILRAGPYVGAGYDGGGLPAWLPHQDDVALREANQPFIDRTSRYYRKLFGELSGLQATKGGPILLVQIEHAYTCGNDDQSERYLRQLARVSRECGIAVPLMNANNLWLDPADTIDTWRGDDDLLVNLRQLRTVQPNAPRIAAVFERASRQAWGQPTQSALTPETMLRRLTEVLAAGGQPLVDSFHGGTNFGFLGGRLPGPDGGTVTTAAAVGPLLGEAGGRGEGYRLVRRLMTFANAFGHVFADLDPDYQPVAIDPSVLTTARPDASLSIVSLRGSTGRVVFVFGDGKATSTTLLLDSGLRIPIDLGKQAVAWYVLDADLHGQGRLDYTNLCPFTVVNRSIVVLYGPAKQHGFLSVNGKPLQVTVPSGGKPVVAEHKGLTFVIVNQTQIDETFFDDEAVYVGISGFDADGAPQRGHAAKAYKVTADKGLATLSAAAASTRRTTRRTLGQWDLASAASYADGTSPRYASLAGPQSLAASGAPHGYGWYRITLKNSASAKKLVTFPVGGDRLHLYVDGKLTEVFGPGPGGERGPIELTLPRGEVVMTILADNLGRFADGNERDEPTGVASHLVQLKRVTGARPKTSEETPVDPFTQRGFILGAAVGQLSVALQTTWTFTHARKTPILVQVTDARAHGTFVLNDEPLAYFAGERGSGDLRLLLDPADERFKRGKNVLRFAPDYGQDEPEKNIAAATTLFECVDSLTEKAKWSFAKWETPAEAAFETVTATEATRRKGQPAWWRTTFTAAADAGPVWFDTTGLSKGQAHFNGHDLGRYFTATVTRRGVGPQTRLLLPSAWLRDGQPNELIVFDEHGFVPTKTKLVFTEAGDLDGG